MCKALSPDLAHCRWSINSSCLLYYLGFPGHSNGKESAHNVGHPVSIPELGRSPGEWNGYPPQFSWASLVAQMEESACNAGNLGSIPGLGRSPGGGHGNPLQYSCLENSMDRGCGPWGHKESNMTGQLTLSLFIVIMVVHSFLLVNIWLFPGCLPSAQDYAGPEGESNESLASWPMTKIMGFTLDSGTGAGEATKQPHDASYPVPAL